MTTKKLELKLKKIQHTMELARLVVPVMCLALQIVILVKVI